jgi:hypothetical protein
VHDGKKWQVKTWNGVDIPAVHQCSRLAGVFMPFGMTVFYQDSEGSLIPLNYSNETNSWQKDPPIPVKAAVGTALFAFLSGRKLYLFYTSNEGDICYQTLNFETGTWEGK